MFLITICTVELLRVNYDGGVTDYWDNESLVTSASWLLFYLELLNEDDELFAEGG